MSGGGLSEARLGRMHGTMAAYVERGEVPGMVTPVARRTRPYMTENPGMIRPEEGR